MTDFASLGLSEPILRAVAGEGYETPTPIQAEAIPLLMDGHDLVGIAQTGAGKTAAFVLPLLHRLEQMRAESLADGRKGGPAPRTCRILILAPTRELASQIGDCIRTYGRYLRPSLAIILGGVKPGPQIKALNQGQEIIVATPGRLLDHASAGILRLEATEAVVLDEADQMMDLGFMPGIRKIMSRLPKDRQTVLLSATMPKQIRSLAEDFLNNPKEVAVTPQSRPVERIEQKVLLTPAGEKLPKLIELLREPEVTRAIVFTRTKRGAEKVATQLNAAGLMAESIHGDKSQGQRERALAAFRGDKAWVLVATDIAARGIDIDGISHVFNFELPNVPESYVHRIGRTARAGASGVAISLCDHAERPLLRDIERLIGATLLPREAREARDQRRPRPQSRPPQEQERRQDYSRQDSGRQDYGRQESGRSEQGQADGFGDRRPQREPAQRRHTPGGRGPAHHDPRFGDGRQHEGRHHEARHGEGRHADGRNGDARHGEPRHADGRPAAEGRFGENRRPQGEGRSFEGRAHGEGRSHGEARHGENRRPQGEGQSRQHETRHHEGRRPSPPRHAEGRTEGGERPPRRERSGQR